MKRLMQGNQAVAHGAWAAGVRVAAGYPGTPSTEILEHLAGMPGVYTEWSPNEKIALDVAIGAAYAGQRAMAVMKHVGLNVAADSFFYAALTGMQAGLVVVVADDPGMYSSQGEQDSRRYAKFARVPCLEPSDSQECLDMMQLAFQLSEDYDVPVMVRLVTRISHSHSVAVAVPDRLEQGSEPPPFPINTSKYVMVPANARHRHPVLEATVSRLEAAANQLEVNQHIAGSCRVGIVTSGVAYQYVREVLPDASYFKVGMCYPLPMEALRRFAASVERLVVVEELDPVLEEALQQAGIACEGKSLFPLVGELSPELVRAGLVRAGLLPAKPQPAMQAIPDLPQRPPVLCPGCPHRGIFTILHKLKVIVNGDIGCYTLGYTEPLAALHTMGCMGASIGVAHGVLKAGVAEQNVAVIGDSTFMHSGMPALLNVVYNRTPLLTIILDNRTTAMTGHQDNPGSGKTLQGLPAHELDFKSLVRAMGIDEVYTIDPYKLEETESILRHCLALDEPSVVIARHGCALLPENRRNYRPLKVDAEKCIACGICRRISCPALALSSELYPKTGRAKTRIDPLLCAGCEICAQVCPTHAILFRRQLDEQGGL